MLFLFTRFRKYILVISIIMALSGGAGITAMADTMAKNGDIVDSTILMAVYTHKEAIRDVISSFTIKDFENGIITVKKILKKIQDDSQRIKLQLETRP